MPDTPIISFIQNNGEEQQEQKPGLKFPLK